VKRLSELPDLVLGALKTYIIEQVVKAGIEYIVALLTPASGFIKACQGIYRLLSFIVDKAKQIADFIEAVLDSMAAIADGDTAAAAEKIDAALAGALKLALGFLAKLAHLDALAEKARAVIEAIRAPVRRVVDTIIDGAVGLYHSTIGSLGARRTERIPATADARASPAGTAHAPPVPHPAAHPGAGPGQLALAHPAPGQPPGTRPSTPVAAQHPADPESITMTVRLTMDRAPHALTFKVIGGQPEVIMSSERAEYLQSVTSAAITDEERGGKRNSLVRDLTRLEKELSDLYYEFRAAEFSKSDRELRYQINVRLEQIADELTSIGQNFGIKTLHHLHHPSKYVGLGNKLKKPYADDVRGYFYPRGYFPGTKQWKASTLSTLLDPQNHPDQFLDQSTSTWEPLQRPSASGQKRGQSNVTIDHQPKVVEHWLGKKVPRAGNNSDADERKRFYNDITPPKLQLVSWRNNSIDGAQTSDEYKDDVGKDFRGPDDEP